MNKVLLMPLLLAGFVATAQIIYLLDLGLYNIIKSYETGDTEETLIFKEDN